MKKKIAILSFALALGGLNTVKAQLSLIPMNVCKEIKPSGWIYFHENTLNSGELTSTYSHCFFPQGSNSIWEVDKEWDDNQINFHHILYQQTYNGIEVEGCQLTEHSRQTGKVVYAHGKICPDINTKYSSETIAESTAMKAVIQFYGNSEFAWEIQSFEDQIKLDANDQNATYYPTGELVFTFINDNAPVQYELNANDFKMAWKFEVTSINPDFHKTVYVDAVTGIVFKENDEHHYDGSANIPHNGTVTLDTRNTGAPFPRNILHTNNNNVDVHTKINSNANIAWGLKSEVKHEAPNWGTDSVEATSVHWGVTETWKYFDDVFDRDGLDDNGGKVRVFASSLTYNGDGAWYDNGAFGIDRIKVSVDPDGVYYGEISILAHEFAHGINHREGKLKNTNEQGALGESFSDIFGFLVKRHVTGINDWEIGVPNSAIRGRRNLQYPNSFGFHIDTTAGILTEIIGQPDTYEGDNWFPYEVYGNDQGGVHINCGIQNHWFYILSMGKTGSNDLGNSFVVNGIGIDKSADITYYNLVNNMQKLSTHQDAMEGAIEYARITYGDCSFEHIETQDAWYAVGLGSWSSCEGAGINENKINFEIYPNPSSDFLNINFISVENKTINIYSIDGKLIRVINNVQSGFYTVNISEFTNGTYIINVNGENVKFVKK